MNRSKNLSALLLLLLVIAFLTSSTPSVEATKHQAKKSKPHHHHKGKGGSGNNTPPHPHSTLFSVFQFGAKGDGHSDDSKALVAAWDAACKVEGATVQIPSGFTFLINPVTLNGSDCLPDLILQIDGTLLAPSQVAWQNESLLQWINFRYAHNFTIRGAGTVDGQAQASHWWNKSTTPAYYLQNKSKHISDKPTALRFYSACNVTVRDIKIINSPRCHLKFDNSLLIKVDSISIFSPEDSPNTDGIHLQNTQNVEVHHSNISCGDDCVSIQTGCSNIHVHHVHCGPGHGISVGGLGENESAVACVSNIFVNDISFQNTQSGVRIKTWPGGKGSVKNVTFSNIRVSNVSTPIVIDQNYCDRTKLACNKNQKRGAVAISGVKYDRIIGTYSWQPILLACSNDSPCTDVDLIDIQLKPLSGHKGSLGQAQCFYSFGKSKAPLVPLSTNCLRREGGPVKRLAKSHHHNSMC